MGAGREDCVFVGQDAQFWISAVDSFRLAFEHSMHRVEAVEARVEAQSALLQGIADQINALDTTNQREKCPNCVTQLTTEIQKAIQDVAHSVIDEFKVGVQSVIDGFGKAHHSKLEEKNDGVVYNVAHNMDSLLLSTDDEYSCVGLRTPSEQSSDGESPRCGAMGSTISFMNNQVDSKICVGAPRSGDASPGSAIENVSCSFDQDTTPRRNIRKDATEGGSDTLQIGLSLSTSVPRLPLPVSFCPQSVSMHQTKGTHGNSEQCPHMIRSHAMPRVQSIVENYCHKGASNVSVHSHSLSNNNKSTAGGSRVRSAVSQWERMTSCGPAGHQQSTALPTLEVSVPVQVFVPAPAESPWPFAVLEKPKKM